MTIDKPKVSTTGRYPRKATAQILGISERTLDRHTKNKKIRCGHYRANKRPFYEGDEIIRYWKSIF